MDTCNRLEEGKWSEGRPVFKKVDGEERFLFVKKEEISRGFLGLEKKGENIRGWSIRKYLTSTKAYMKSGRATNSPTSTEAGPSDKYGTTRWRYRDGGEWIEGDINVTCKSDYDSEYDKNDRPWDDCTLRV